MCFCVDSDSEEESLAPAEFVNSVKVPGEFLSSAEMPTAPILSEVFRFLHTPSDITIT